MPKIEKIIQSMQQNAKNIDFVDLEKVCLHYFGEPRNNGTSHFIYKTPWQGDPRINIQKDKGGKSKAYQVKQVLLALERLKG